MGECWIISCSLLGGVAVLILHQHLPQPCNSSIPPKLKTTANQIPIIVPCPFCSDSLIPTLLNISVSQLICLPSPQSPPGMFCVTSPLLSFQSALRLRPSCFSLCGLIGLVWTLPFYSYFLKFSCPFTLVFDAADHLIYKNLFLVLFFWNTKSDF